MSAGEEDIWMKAIRAPGELTDEEKRQITRWPTENVIEENVSRVHLRWHTREICPKGCP